MALLAQLEALREEKSERSAEVLAEVERSVQALEDAMVNAHARLTLVVNRK